MAHVHEDYDQEKRCSTYTVTADSEKEIKSILDLIEENYASVDCRIDKFPTKRQGGKYVSQISVTDISGVAAKDVRF